MSIRALFASFAMLTALTADARPATHAAAHPGANREQPRELAIQTGKQYRDYYGTAITRQASLLSTPARSFRWGVTNPKTQEMAYLGGTLLSDAKHSQRFRAFLHIDAGIKAPMVFTFRAGDRNGEVLGTYTLKPGETLPVDLKLDGVKALFFSTELRINHDKATRVILGEPTFE
jgi:hypothetical protein